MPGERETPRSGESLPRAQRLCRREDYRRCYRKGRRNYGSHLTLYFIDNRCGHSRIGLTVSRKVGRAVVRVKLKRRFREIYRRWPQRKELRPLDLVVHAKASSATATFGELERDLVQGLLRALESPARVRRPKRS
ncbi:MAG: ribonuclease P protein component [Acidobacteria bacterium]|nr:ribonuclease P protein component [Acidobacteriota bacterium]